MRKYILMYDYESDGYVIIAERHIDGVDAPVYITIDDVVYDDVLLGAQECQQLSNLMGEKQEDAG